MTNLVPSFRTDVIVPPTGGGGIMVPPGNSVVIGIQRPSNINVSAGTSGPRGPVGPEGGTPCVAVPYDEWPPQDPQPNTLYLRLVP